MPFQLLRISFSFQNFESVYLKKETEIEDSYGKEHQLHDGDDMAVTQEFILLTKSNSERQ